MRRPLRSSIRGKLVILIAVVVTLSAVLTAVVVPRLVSRDILSMMEQRDLLLVRELAARCEQIIVSERPGRVAAQLAHDPVLAVFMSSRMSQLPYYLRLALIDSRDSVLYSVGRGDVPLAAFQARRLFGEKHDDFIISQEFGPETIYQIGSAINHRATYLGSVILVVSESQARREFNHLWAVIIIIFVILSVVGLLAAIILSLMLTYPLERLAASIDRVMAGDLEAKLEFKTGDEIEALGDGFNRMLESLKEARLRDLSANPLTGLPGNSIIEQRIGELIRQDRVFAVLYADLDHFKEFNDQYGFVRGDEVIRFSAMLLAQALHELGGQDSFLGHVGGDDFVLICEHENAALLAAALVKRFNAAIDQYYDPKDRRAGYIAVPDRAGRIKRFGLMTLTVAVVTNKYRPIRHIGQFSQLAAQLKKQAKQRKRDKIAFDRRHEAGSGRPSA
jgi:diguanylate cyclase (GGDEF)-like protein